ncbi:MAG: hypothetical protein LUG94_07415 [Ruminococcus sp.]|nr:hypothetical protein [Ruminococcus sp.]
MFENEIQEAINTFDEYLEYEFINIENLLNEAKEKNTSLYKDLKSCYDMFLYHQSQGEIFAGSEYLSSVKSDTVTLYKKYKSDTPIINSFMGFLCLHDKEYKNAKTYFLKDSNFLDAFYVIIKKYEEYNDFEDKKTAFNIAKKELEYECREKDNLYIDYAIFRFVIECCSEIDDFSSIVSLIEIMYSMPFKKNQKFEDFYYCIIKIASIKNIKLKFLKSKEFLSKENFQTVCIQVKDFLLSTIHEQKTIVISFDDLINKAETFKKQNDFQNAESSYREAIQIAENSKQRYSAFKSIYNMYQNTDQVKMLSIIDEFFEKDVFESEFFKYYARSKMLISTKSENTTIYESLNLLCNSLYTYERKSWHWNEPIIQCMDLIKIHIQNLLHFQMYDEAHSMCKMGLNLNSNINKHDTVTDNYMKYFSNVQTQCGKVKKDLAKKGTAKINETPTIKLETKKSNKENSFKDMDNMPMFKFNPSGIFQCVDISTTENYERFINEFGKNINRETISKKVLKLINNVEVSHYIKSIYIQDNTFMGTPKQARSDIDFYLNHSMQFTPQRKRDEYLSFSKIIKDVLDKHGEFPEYDITQNVLKKYIMNAMKYHSECVTSDESRNYYLNVAELIRREVENII